MEILARLAKNHAQNLLLTLSTSPLRGGVSVNYNTQNRKSQGSKMSNQAQTAAQKASEILRSFNRAEHVCAVCGKTFTAYKQAKYCSNACRQKAKYARAKAAKE